MLKEIINKLDYTKVKNFYLSKYTIKINKMQVTEDIYNVPDKGLCLECTKTYKSIRRRPNNQLKKWAKHLKSSLQKRASKWPIDTWNSISCENATQKHNELVFYNYQNGQN